MLVVVACALWVLLLNCLVGEVGRHIVGRSVSVLPNREPAISGPDECSKRAASLVHDKLCKGKWMRRLSSTEMVRSVPADRAFRAY
jgi:hypothetical protein